MLIDWFTVFAQIVNFLVLVGLMKRFLYGPLIEAIDTRERKIAERLADAEERQNAAAACVAEAQEKLANIDQQREQLVTDARSEADRRRGEMIEQARTSVRRLENQWREELARDRTAFLAEVRSRTASEVLSVARRALSDLANADLEIAAIGVFLDRVRELDIATLQSLAKDGIVIATPKELDAQTKCAIQGILDGRIKGPIAIRFERVAAMSWGIEMRGAGQRIGWTPDSYLDRMQENLNTALDRAAPPACSAMA